MVVLIESPEEVTTVSVVSKTTTTASEVDTTTVGKLRLKNVAGVL